MIGKLICYGKNRAEAIAVMQRALEEFAVEPLKTTVPLHQKILSSPMFQKGNVNTNFLDSGILIRKGK